MAPKLAGHLASLEMETRKVVKTQLSPEYGYDISWITDSVSFRINTIQIPGMLTFWTVRSDSVVLLVMYLISARQ